MKTIEIDFVCGLVERVNTHLIQLARPKPLPANREALFQRFEESNDWAKEQLRSALYEQYPEVEWLDAEFEPDKLSPAALPETYWICDPIDGAIQFLQGLAGWTTTLCLMEKEHPVFSLVYDVERKEAFYAYAGAGAFLNGKPLHVACKPDLADAFLATAHPSFMREDVEETQALLKASARIMPRVFALRMLGTVSLQLAYVAAGRLDGYWEYGHDLFDWLAGSLLVKEAGGTVSGIRQDSLAGQYGDGVIAANAQLHEKLQLILNAVQ
ncbi:inositol monophosphatase family protein [Ktedonosporobacter rubrisoli]|nr:inositol monophosphatase family protein [Ktedonosporobacter rubrisoli]